MKEHHSLSLSQWFYCSYMAEIATYLGMYKLASGMAAFPSSAQRN